MTALNQPFQAAASGGEIDDSALVGSDPSLVGGISLLSETSLDAFWAELDGDLVPDDASSLGPFDTGDTGSESWQSYTEISIDIDVTIEITDMSMPVLLPYEVDAGYTDPFMLPTQDWCMCESYDPMAAPTDWTTDGYATFEDPFTLPGSDFLVSDAGSYYDSYDPGAGYWDTGSYYDSTGDFLATPDAYGTWDDLSSAYGDQGVFGDGTYDTSGAYDTTSGFDTTSTYDPMSTWDPTAGDAAHEAFIDTITEDYSSSYADPTDWSAAADDSQFWMDEYNAAEDLSWDAWNNSVDASIAGDDMAAYDWNQQSLDWGATADDAWDASSDAWSTTDW
ncbi:MAG TPA: hypothetical protein VFN21_05695 [Acidimicrobiales bacterium]|nr:hypothetical protein [Acidimicrobiales bacterium]